MGSWEEAARPGMPATIPLQAEESIRSLLSRGRAGREGWELLREVLWGLNQSAGIP